MARDEIKIRALLILEIIGRPPEHLKEALKGFIEKMGEEKSVTVISHNIKEPVQMKDRKDFFTTFAEIEVEVEELNQLSLLMFKYMPAHVEIISPERISLDNNTLGNLFSEVTRRLHGYEELARMMQVEKGILIKKLEEAMRNSSNKEKTKKSGKKK